MHKCLTSYLCIAHPLYAKSHVVQICSVFHNFSYFSYNTDLYSGFLSTVSSLGQSVEVRTIWALEISNKPEEAEPSEPKIRFVAGIHGNAPVGTELLLEFAAFLCMNYGNNPAVTRVSEPPQEI